MKKLFLNLVPKIRNRRWDALGSGLKWISGVPDADDLREIHENFEKVQKNQESLAEANNGQQTINLISQDRINDIAKALSTSISSRLNESFTSLEILHLMFNIDLANDKLKSISDALVLSKLKICSKNILEERELEIIFKRLTEQNLTFSSTTEMLSYVEAQVQYKEDTIYYHVNIPQLEDGFEKLHVEPLPRDGKEIQFDSTEILVKGEKTFAIKEKCLETLSNVLCKPNQLQDISNDLCVPLLVRNLQSECVFRKADMKMRIKVISDGALILKNANEPVKLFNSCGIANHTIAGTLLVMFKNCSVSVNNETFDNLELKSKTGFEILPFFNVTIRQKNIEPLVDLHELHDLHIENKKHLEMIHLTREQDQWLSFSVIAIIAVITFVVIGVITFLVKKHFTTFIMSQAAGMVMENIKPHRDGTDLRGEKSSPTTISSMIK